MILLNLLVKPLAIFGIDAKVQNEVGSEAFGLYFALLNFSVLFNILLDFGITNFTTKSIAQSPITATKYFEKVLVFRFLLFILYAIVSYGIAFAMGWNYYELYLLSFLVFNQFIIALIAYARSHFGGLLMFKTDAFISVLDRLLLIILCGTVLLYSSDFKIEWYIWIQTICYVLALIISLVLLFVKIGVPKLNYHKTFSYAIVRRSLPYALLILLMMLYTRVDSVMIERIHPNGKAEAGYYAQGFRLLSAFFMFAMLFSNLLFPLFSKMFKLKLDVIPLLSTSSKLLLGASMVIAVISYFNSDFILHLIYSADVEYSVETFKLLMLSFIGMCATVIFGTLLTAKGSLRFLNQLSAAGLAVNIAINYSLIPTYGAWGAAIATLITQSIVAILQFIACYRVLQMKFSIQLFLRFILFVCALVSVGYFLPANSLGLFTAVVCLSVLLLFVFKLIDIREIKAIINTERELE